MFYLIYLFTGLLISSFIHLLINSTAYSLICSPAHFLAQSLTFLICPLTPSLIYSFTTQLSPGARSAPGSRTGKEVPSPCACCELRLPDRPSCVAWPPPRLPRPQQDAPLLVKVHPSCPPGLRAQARRNHIGLPYRVWWEASWVAGNTR